MSGERSSEICGRQAGWSTHRGPPSGTAVPPAAGTLHTGPPGWSLTKVIVLPFGPQAGDASAVKSCVSLTVVELATSRT